jgi:hypothetical protein
MSDFNVEFVAVAKFQPKHPGTRLPMERNGQPTYLLLHGKDSPAFRKIVRAQRKRHVEELSKSRDYIPTDEQAEAEVLEVLVACTAGWENGAYKGVEEFSPELVKTMYTEQVWLREDVDRYIGDRANFLAPSKGS